MALVRRASARVRGRLVLALTAVVTLVATLFVGLTPAASFPNPDDEPSFVQFTLEACRLTEGTTLPIAGEFICPDAMYTTGNLGKSWNELDLVPHRLTTASGSQSGATTDYKVMVAADGITGGKVGYDVLGDPAVNAAKSHSSCTVSANDTATSGTASDPFGGGTDTVIYRDFTIHQSKNTTCVIDWYQRLALTSHKYPGASLQSYMFPAADFGGSKKTISIPVNMIEPQSLSKDMSASQTQDYVWNISKSASPTSLDFSDTCAPSGRSASVAVTVSWTRVLADPSAITIITHVYAKNPSARSITTTVADRIYAGATQTTQVHPTKSPSSVTDLSATVVVPAGQTVKVIDYTGTVPAGTATSFNNVATGSYADEVTGVAITQTTTASSSAQVATVQGSNGTATISDTESIDGGFHFSVDSTSGATGAFTGYTLGTSTTGPVVWTSAPTSASGSVTFNKTVTADGPTYVTAADNRALSDTASVDGSGGFHAEASLDVGLTGGATLRIGVNKNMQGGVTGTQTFVFDVYAGSNPDESATGLTLVDTITIQITPPAVSGSGSISVPATGTSNTFTVVERASAHWAAQPNQVLTLSLPSCTGSATFNNTFGPATAKVKKVTIPAGNEAGWTFTLSGPGTPAGGEQALTTDSGYVNFTTPLEQGDYVITEADRPGFDFTSTSGTCSFSVVYPDDADQSFSCSFTNTERGSLQITKNVDWNGVPVDPAATFEICITGPSYPTTPDCKTVDSDGATLTWTSLLPGDYHVAETTPGSSWVVSGGDGATVAVDPGANATAPAITNTRKLGSLQVTKNVDWNGVTPVEAQTFEVCLSGPSYPTTPDCKEVDSDGATLTWSNLIPGDYTATETAPGVEWSVAGSPTATITVPTDGTTAALVPVITNTRKLGALQITKRVDWNGVTPVIGQTFEICITGPSHPVTPDCKDFVYDADLVHTWTGLIPGSYTITETGPGSSWTKTGDTSATVPVDGGTATASVTNTRKLGSLQVTKTVDWSGAAPDTSATFEICISGPSYPSGDCTTVGSSGGVHTWTDLIPGEYAVAETDPGVQWIVVIAGSPATVPANGGQATASVDNELRKGAAKVVKTILGAAPTGEQFFTFQLRSGASPTLPGTVLETGVAGAGNGGVIEFATELTPGATYQLCESGLLPGWSTSLTGFVPDGDGPTVDNSVVCADFTAVAGDTTTFAVENTPPPEGRAHTIGYWKNWASCTSSSTRKKPVLDQTLAAAEPNGVVVSATSGTQPAFGETYYLVLHGSTTTPNSAPSCSKAVSLLNKSNFSGKKMASDPAFNMAAQLVAAQLNYVAGAKKPAAATAAINQAVLLLGKYKFTGSGYQGKISSTDAAAMNTLARTLDDYNNNRL